MPRRKASPSLISASGVQKSSELKHRAGEHPQAAQQAEQVRLTPEADNLPAIDLVHLAERLHGSLPCRVLPVGVGPNRPMMKPMHSGR
jgi:hypothetical protein